MSFLGEKQVKSEAERANAVVHVVGVAAPREPASAHLLENALGPARARSRARGPADRGGHGRPLLDGRLSGPADRGLRRHRGRHEHAVRAAFRAHGPHRARLAPSRPRAQGSEGRGPRAPRLLPNRAPVADEPRCLRRRGGGLRVREGPPRRGSSRNGGIRSCCSRAGATRRPWPSRCRRARARSWPRRAPSPSWRTPASCAPPATRRGGGRTCPRVESFAGEGHGWQVLRSALEAVLRRAAATAGVVVRDARVREVRRETADRFQLVTERADEPGALEAVRARQVVDASGRAGVVARRFRVAPTGPAPWPSPRSSAAWRAFACPTTPIPWWRPTTRAGRGRCRSCGASDT